MTEQEIFNEQNVFSLEVDDYAENNDDFQIDEYDITASPNDFNIMTIYHFMESGAIIIPAFQRNFVWDLARASKLIESLILGLPIPQIFLYEEGRNKFLVIDGQQRLMSIYYFIKGRFPRSDKRAELRRIFAQHNRMPTEILESDDYFAPFKLNYRTNANERPNKFKGLTYSILGDYQAQFNLRPIRNIIIKQNLPKDDDSSIYEIFNRLNTGGVNLRPQEIRNSLYQSDFYGRLNRLNMLEEWRRLLNMPDLDTYAKDIEILLRGYAMLINGRNYSPSMASFLNKFSRDAKKYSSQTNEYLELLFRSFLSSCKSLPDEIFISKRTRRFNLTLYEAVFVASCDSYFSQGTLIDKDLSTDRLNALANDPVFLTASLEGTSGTTNVRIRLDRAHEILNKVN